MFVFPCRCVFVFGLVFVCLSLCSSCSSLCSVLFVLFL